MSDTFLCYLVEKDNAGQTRARVVEQPRDALPPGEVLIEVAWSSLNYKDALSASGHPGVTRKFPHVPGIDLAGRVVESQDPQYRPGDEVLVTGYGLGMDHWGGFAALARVPAEWVVPLPHGLTQREAMIYGTAGFTAAQCVDALLRHGVEPARGEVVVSGASGGVGSIAVGILSHLGYKVVAVTGKPDAEGLLVGQLGASRIAPRSEVDDTSGKPLLGARWAGAVDTVGGNTLSTILRTLQSGGCAAACGLVGGAELHVTVYPFILRGVTLAGIDSAGCPRQQRLELWNKLAGPWKPPALESIAQETDLNGLAEKIQQILAGKITGRVLVSPR